MAGSVDSKKTEWTPESEDEPSSSGQLSTEQHGHQSRPHSNTTSPHSSKNSKNSVPKRKKLSTEEYVQGILAKDRTILSRAITLVESNSAKHATMAQEVLTHLLPKTGKSIRIGITGVPGVGKSTFIEALGGYLCDQGHRVAVLAVDPSSTLSKGSILGDKTRMNELSRRAEAFIRPSPSSGTLGGVAQKTRETMLLCEAYGFDVIFIETVGVGQSEVTVRSMVDFFLLLMLSGAGDELQGIKKGIVELADALLINKADGDNKSKALRACREYANALHYLTPATEGWKPSAYTCSAVTQEGIDRIWKIITQFMEQTQESGIFQKRRDEQAIHWMHSMIREYLQVRFYQHPAIQKKIPSIEQQMLDGTITPAFAFQTLIALFEEQAGDLDLSKLNA